MSISTNEASDLSADILRELGRGEQTLTQLFDALRPSTLAEIGRELFELVTLERVVGVFRVTGPDGVAVGDFASWSDVPDEMCSSNGETFRVGPGHVEVVWSRRDGAGVE